MDRAMAICRYLHKYHTGRERAVHSSELQELFSVNARNLRRHINRLRQEGFPICSDETGYYYADSQQEINKTVCRLNGLVTQVSNARTGLLYASVFPVAVNVEIKVSMEGDDVCGRM